MHAPAHEEVLDELLEQWHALAADPDSSERVEITEHGEIIVSPLPTNRHQAIGAAVAWQLRAQLGGAAIQELSVLTQTAGIRCPDVAWLPNTRLNEIMDDGPMLTVPPLVVEVLSPGNRKSEIAHKIAGYLGSGAQEVIVVALDGKVSYHRLDGVHAESALGVVLTPPTEFFRS